MAPYCDKLRPKLREALSASLATVCEQATAGLSMLNTRQRPVAPFLALVYGSRAFRQWWITAETACSQELKMCLGYRENDLCRLDILIAGEPALPLAAIVHREEAHGAGTLLTPNLSP